MGFARNNQIDFRGEILMLCPNCNHCMELHIEPDPINSWYCPECGHDENAAEVDLLYEQKDGEYVDR